MSGKAAVRLGINIDHVATLRNARGGSHPDPVRAGLVAIEAGAHGITAHLREDRRHIRDDDIRRIRAEIRAPLNLEMAATEEMVRIALKILPRACCLVPERREEITTEGGLDVPAGERLLRPVVKRLSEAGIRVSLFIDPDRDQVEGAAALGAAVVELHTGRYCGAFLRGDRETAAQEAARLADAAALASRLGMEVHAGHGLTYETAEHLSALPEVSELNIGHFLIGEAVFVGLPQAISSMLSAIARGIARRTASSS